MFWTLTPYRVFALQILSLFSRAALLLVDYVL